MKTEFGWGILGPGRIATRFATDLGNLPEARLVAVGSRTVERAELFAQRFHIERAYGSYEDLARDPDVDVVYVATPNPFHPEHAMLCLRHGKAVLCEKPMAVNEWHVQRMVECARENGVFLMEAMWTRFLPVMDQVRGWLAEGKIGDVRLLSADFGFRTEWNPQGRLLNPDLAGGALLDVGIYVLALASMVMGGSPVEIEAVAHIGETGVDEQSAMLCRYRGGALALLSCAVRTQTPQEARIHGTAGSIHIPGFWHATTATLQVYGQDPVQVVRPAGYHYEAAEAMSCLRAGVTESSLMPLDESIAIARTLDRVRAYVGLAYSMDRVAEDGSLPG
jgi:dihydrodiol dehydrogenase / D-xylose 1-dehydrogenase (NADP)